MTDPEDGRLMSLKTIILSGLDASFFSRTEMGEGEEIFLRVFILHKVP